MCYLGKLSSLAHKDNKGRWGDVTVLNLDGFGETERKRVNAEHWIQLISKTQQQFGDYETVFSK